ncbi:hypothetical protein J6590_105864 [Homalodisca vitripennis]|nr:hypothetical protein J6590_105864 [Homalodisca vitripennis]
MLSTSWRKKTSSITKGRHVLSSMKFVDSVLQLLDSVHFFFGNAISKGRKTPSQSQLSEKVHMIRESEIIIKYNAQTIGSISHLWKLTSKFHLHISVNNAILGATICSTVHFSEFNLRPCLNDHSPILARSELISSRSCPVK